MLADESFATSAGFAPVGKRKEKQKKKAPHLALGEWFFFFFGVVVVCTHDSMQPEILICSFTLFFFCDVCVCVCV